MKAQVGKFYKLSKDRRSLQVSKWKNKYAVIVWDNYGTAFYMMGARSGSSIPYYHTKKQALIIADRIIKNKLFAE
jgi:hypothetical protein